MGANIKCSQTWAEIFTFTGNQRIIRQLTKAGFYVHQALLGYLQDAPIRSRD